MEFRDKKPRQKKMRTADFSGVEVEGEAQGIASEVREMIQSLEPMAIALYAELHRDAKLLDHHSAVFQLYPEHREQFIFPESAWEPTQARMQVEFQSGDNVWSRIKYVQSLFASFPGHEAEIKETDGFSKIVEEFKTEVETNMNRGYGRIHPLVSFLVRFDPEFVNNFRTQPNSPNDLEFTNHSFGQGLLRDDLESAANHILFVPQDQVKVQQWVERNWDQIKTVLSKITNQVVLLHVLDLLASLQIIFARSPQIDEHGQITLGELPARLSQKPPLPVRAA